MTTLFPPTLDHVPVGFRFRPTDEELVNHYLKKKLLGNDSIVNNVIAEVDVCNYEPWDLPAFSVVKSDDPEWFFLCPIDYKYAKSKRFKRTTNTGFWKATGKDRKIKVRGSNNIIGIKKTLVYYNGRVPGVKSSWVIHEYHDTTFEDDKRTFVLCRLMKKAEKKAEKEAEADIHDEGEPSRHMSSDHESQEIFEGIPDVSETLPEINMESIFQAQEENFFPFSPQQSSISENEQEVSIPNSRLHDAYFRNDNIIVQSPFKTIEEEDKFISSMIIDGDLDSGHVQSESLKMVYYGSSDTDAECGDILDTSTAFLEHPSSGEYCASKLLKSTHGNVHGSTCFQSLKNGEIEDNNESTFQDYFGGLEASSCDSTADIPLEMINCIKISSSPSTLRKHKNQYHPRPAIFMSKRAASKRS
ncbi:NAC domain-containing protein 69 isoform X2 [Medicago truncatula]|uniref:NAC domain-containing protein 69 isoform X2 n=1 Tax=Medicago truncatula TaxID=3880 RepID=UPI000D2F36E8|nr:NAC domain-containing protein 69 isoform X2 [Medicago truncatula]